MKLTDYVTTGETRSMFDFSARRLSDVMAEISKYITSGIQSSCMVGAFYTNSRYQYLHIEGLQSLFIHNRAHSFRKCTFNKVIYSATEINSPFLWIIKILWRYVHMSFIWTGAKLFLTFVWKIKSNLVGLLWDYQCVWDTNPSHIPCFKSPWQNKPLLMKQWQTGQLSMIEDTLHPQN